MASHPHDFHEFVLDTNSAKFIHPNRNSTTFCAKWLVIENVYEKLHRPNIYDAGCTYDQGFKDVIFTFQTERLFCHHLLHVFALGRINHCMLAISCHNEISNFRDKMSLANNVCFPSPYQYYDLKNEDKSNDQYIKTFYLTDLDVAFLKGKTLYISIGLSKFDVLLNPHPLNEIKSRHNFRHLLGSQNNTDFVIETMDGEKLDVHKVLIAAKSSVFAAMLKEDTAESQSNFVKLHDMTGDDLKQLLHFIYTGSLQDYGEINYMNLFILADKYDVSGLAKLCEHRLLQDLAPDNAIDLLLAGDIYNSHRLKFAAMKFIKKNPMILKSAPINDITNVDLIKELSVYCEGTGAKS